MGKVLMKDARISEAYRQEATCFSGETALLGKQGLPGSGNPALTVPSRGRPEDLSRLPKDTLCQCSRIYPEATFLPTSLPSRMALSVKRGAIQSPIA